MQKNTYIILTVTAIVLAGLIGYFIGRSNIDGEVHLFADHRPQTIGTININTATIDELMQLPGIGELTAQNIVDYRTRKGYFNTVDELCNISGISTRKLDEIRKYIRVD